MPAATVLIPTFNHGPTLRLSVASALAQTVEDLEVFIVGDGAPDVTREIVSDLMKRDARVRYFDNPKGARHGETYRHHALAQARGRIVCYLSDDDLWLPEHVETMAELLDGADYANALMVHVDAGGKLGVTPLDLSRERERQLLLAGVKGTSLSCMAHTLSMYRRLPYGWRTTPRETYSDRYMQQQFLADTDCRAVSSMRPTMVHFKSPERVSWTLDERVRELEEWQLKLGDPAGRADFVCEVLEAVIREQVALRYRLEESAAWRLYNRLRELPLLGPLISSAARAGVARPGGRAGEARRRARR